VPPDINGTEEKSVLEGESITSFISFISDHEERGPLTTFDEKEN
jgi:hypothetical protein